MLMSYISIIYAERIPCVCSLLLEVIVKKNYLLYRYCQYRMGYNFS